MAEYQKALGDALQKIQELQRKITENKQYTNMNKKRTRLTEQDLHRIVKASVNRILNEGSRKGVPYKHFPENSYDKAFKIQWMLYDIQKMLEKLQGLYNDAYSDEFNRRIQDVYSFACDALQLMDRYALKEGEFDSDDYFVLQ